MMQPFSSFSVGLKVDIMIAPVGIFVLFIVLFIWFKKKGSKCFYLIAYCKKVINNLFLYNWLAVLFRFEKCVKRFCAV